MSDTITQHKPELKQVTEQLTDWHTEALIIDAAQHVVRNIALTGLQSKNGYHYSPAALQEALPLYENKPVFLDHAVNKAQPYQRSTRDLVGTVTAPRFDKDRILADIQVLETEAGRTFLALAESNLPAVGMSQVVIAERNPGSETGHYLVQRIHEVVSIDAVMFPATTSNMREQTDSLYASLDGSLEQFLNEFDQQLAMHLAAQLPVNSHDIQRVALFAEQVLVEVYQAEADFHYLLDWKLLDDQSLVFQFADPQAISTTKLAESNWYSQQKPIATGFQPDALNAQTQNLLTEIEQLRRKRDKLLAELSESQANQELQQEIDALLTEAELPDYAVTELFREQLLQADSISVCKSLIADRLRVLRDQHRQPPTSRLRLQTDQPVHSDDAIISAIKRQPLSVLSRSA